MRIKTVHVQRFRSIYDATLECDNLTALVGANGAGKSTFLRALDIFYKPTARIDRRDYYADDPSEPIRIVVTYDNLSATEQVALGKYFHNGQLVVEKRFEWGGDKPKQSYHGQMLRHRPFEEHILSKGSWNEKRRAYNELRQNAPYTSLNAVNNEAALRTELSAWEQSNPAECELLTSETQFFGFNQAGSEKLERFTRFLLVPAIRDAHAEATDERGSLINALIDMVIRKTLAERMEVQQLQEEASEKLRQIQDLTGSDLIAVNQRLNKTLQQFAPNTTVDVNWQRPAINLPLPKVDVSLSEDGYRTTIERSGHGVQRAFIISLLQDLTMRQGDTAPVVPIPPAAAVAVTLAPTETGSGAQLEAPPLGIAPVPATSNPTFAVPNDTAAAEATLPEPGSDTLAPGPASEPSVTRVSDSEPAAPEPPHAETATEGTNTPEELSLILAIEEPELFQHPARQRHFARILHDLALGRISGVARSIQVLYCTHSPIFVDIDRFEQVRVIAKQISTVSDAPKQTTVRAVSRILVEQTGINQAKLAAMLTSSVNEGFFADFVVLVEGDGDRALLQGVARLMDVSLEAHGIVVISVDGKGSLAKPLAIFSRLQIPTFLIWDNDSHHTKENDRNTASKLNRDLLTLCSCPPEDWPSGVYDSCAVFNPRLEDVLRNDIAASGIIWQTVEDEVVAITGDKNIKRHGVVTHIVQKAAARGCMFATVRPILQKIYERARIAVATPVSTVEVTSVSIDRNGALP